LGGVAKKGLPEICERKFLGKSGRTAFRESLVKFGQKSLAPPKFSFCYTYGCSKCFHWRFGSKVVSATVWYCCAART